MFDQILVEVFGEEKKRGFWPHPKDGHWAAEFDKLGLTLDKAQRLFRQTQQARLKAGEPPIDKLSYYSTMIEGYLAEGDDDPLKNFVYAEDQERMEANLKKVKAEIEANQAPPPVNPIVKLLADRAERERAAQAHVVEDAETS